MSSYSAPDRQGDARAPMGAGMAFLWVALLANLAWFSAFAVSTARGIIEAVMRGSAPAPENVSVGAGGAQWALIEIGGPLLLGLGLAYAVYRYHTRNRRLDRDVNANARPVHDLSADRAAEAVRY